MSGTTTTLLVTGALIGKTVTFTSKNPTDPTVYKGVVSGIISSDLAGGYYGDRVSYNAGVQRSDPTVGDIAVLNYFVITLTNGQSMPAQRLFADEWIAVGSFSVIQDATVFNINVFDLPSNGVNAIIGVLRAAGYNAVPVST